VKPWLEQSNLNLAKVTIQRISEKDESAFATFSAKADPKIDSDKNSDPVPKKQFSQLPKSLQENINKKTIETNQIERHKLYKDYS
jgi:hypothetical protein